MTQIFGSKSPASRGVSEKQELSPPPMSSSKPANGSSHFPTKFKNFFRISSLGSNNSIGSDVTTSPKAEGKPFRQSRFLGISRNRSATVTSEGNRLDESVSPIVHANPYFAHQGLPKLRHHNEGSIPPSPPDSPPSRIDGTTGVNDQATTAGKEELARKLRRVASAPNAQGLFSGNKSNDRPQTAEMGKEPLVQNELGSALEMVDTSKAHMLSTGPDGLPSPGQIRENAAFRRTYSSNSIKVRNVEVEPSSFDKIKLIGKGDVGKVYLVREKKSSRLYAMKGK